MKKRKKKEKRKKKKKEKKRKKGRKQTVTGFLCEASFTQVMATL